MRVAIAGAAGRMGRMLIEAVLKSDDLKIAAALEAAGNAALGRDAGDSAGTPCGVKITADLGVLTGADCLIDFTRPEGSLAHLERCAAAGTKMVIGTTGFSPEEKRRIAEASNRIGIVFAPNMAVAVNATFKLAEVAARILGEAYDVEIVEAHHRHKVDAPSGTALRLGEVIATALGRDLKSAAIYGREGITGERDPKTIAIHALRGGDIVGEHTVMFAGVGERLEITVRSSSRVTYALGALRACRFLKDRQSGLYDMQDVLGLR